MTTVNCSGCGRVLEAIGDHAYCPHCDTSAQVGGATSPQLSAAQEYIDFDEVHSTTGHGRVSLFYSEGKFTLNAEITARSEGDVDAFVRALRATKGLIRGTFAED